MELVTIEDVFNGRTEDVGETWFFTSGGKKFLLTGVKVNNTFDALYINNMTRFSFIGSNEVEWIGNKPKTKKLYAYLMLWKHMNNQKAIDYHESDDIANIWAEHNNATVLATANEADYPPIEVEV